MLKIQKSNAHFNLWYFKVSTTNQMLQRENVSIYFVYNLLLFAIILIFNQIYFLSTNVIWNEVFCSNMIWWCKGKHSEVVSQIKKLCWFVNQPPCLTISTDLNSVLTVAVKIVNYIMANALTLRISFSFYLPYELAINKCDYKVTYKGGFSRGKILLGYLSYGKKSLCFSFPHCNKAKWTFRLTFP